MKIGIDLDDTVWKFHEKFFEYYNHKNGTNYLIKDLLEYSVQNFLKLTEKETIKLFDEFDESLFFEEVYLLDNFLESLKKIKEKHEIFFITARPSYSLSNVIKRFKKFIDCDPKIHFVRDTENNIITKKFEIAGKLGVEIMIDDAFKHLDECSKNGINGILINYPWNKNKKLPKNIVRVNNWEEIVLEVEKYEKSRQ